MPIPGPERNNPRVAILGSGAVGGFLAALFARAGCPVTCVTTERSARVINEQGIRLESATFGDHVMRPQALTVLTSAPSVLFVTVKATALREAIQRVDPECLEDCVVVPLLNGLEHMDMLRARFGRRVVAATIGHVELKRAAVNHVQHLSPSALIEISSDGDVPSRDLGMVTELLISSGVKVNVLANEAEVLWRKIVRLNAIACVSAAADQPLGLVRSESKWRKCLEGCVIEAAQVASFDGVKVDVGEVMRQIDALPASLMTSMHRDIATGRENELDAIAGSIVRRGERCGVKCSVIEELIRSITVSFEKRMTDGGMTGRS